jgi:prepilin signal peptidase PulO-like enzyme (type II secretory pathway)
LASARAINVAPATAKGYAPSLRSVVVAAVAGTVAAFAFRSLPFGPSALIASFAAAVLVVVAATDLELRLIPNRIVLPATAILLVARIASSPGRTLEWTAAAVLAAVVLLLPRLRNPAAMGMGDVKLAMLIGVALGWSVFLALAVAFASVLPVAVVLVARRGLAARKTPIPFGPFLAAGALFVLFASNVTGSPTG